MSASPQPSPSPLRIAFLTIFLDLLGFGILIPIQPFYTEGFGATPAQVTWLSASYSLMQFLFSPMWGRLSDRIGRRPVVLISIFFGGLGYLFFGLAGSLTMLFLSRILSGFGNANIGTAQAIIADVTGPEDRAKGMGLIGAAFGLGFIFGPAIGGGLGQFGATIPIFAAALLSLLNLLVAYFWLPETNRRRVQTQTATPAAPPKQFRILPWQGLGEALQIKKVPTLLSIAFVSIVGFALMEQVIGLFIEWTWLKDSLTQTGHQIQHKNGSAHYQQATRLTTYFLLVVGVVVSVVQGGLIGKLNKRYGELRLIRAGFLISTTAFVLIPISGMLQSYTLLLFVGGLIAFGTGLSTPSLNSYLSRSAPDDVQGSILGLSQSASALGRVIGPAFSGLLFQWQIRLPFWVAASLMGLTFLISLRLRPIEQTTTAAKAT